MNRVLLLVLLGCGQAPYEVYWDDPDAAPAIDGVSPAQQMGFAGGETITLSGKRLGSTRTVVFGGRNAEVLERSASSVQVRVPDAPAGGGVVDIGLVTDDGQVVVEDAYVYDLEPGIDWWADETASAMIMRLDCPIELWTFTETDDYAEIWWCGFEQGYADAYGFYGVSRQQGMAGDLSGFATLSALPALGEARLIGPGERLPPAAPVVYGARADDEWMIIEADRDFAQDVLAAEAWDARIDDYYFWTDSFSRRDVPAGIRYDGDECVAGTVDIDGAAGDALVLAESVDGAGGIGVGFGITEWFDWNEDGVEDADEVYDYDIPISSATGVGDGDTFFGDPSGVTLGYDWYSGFYLPGNVGGIVLAGDMPMGVTYNLGYERLGETLGSVETLGAKELVLSSPDLMSGYMDDGLAFAYGEDLDITWAPAAPDDDPSYVVIELVIYDSTIPDPNWMTEVGRIIVHGDDVAGQATIPGSLIAELPMGDGIVDDEDNEWVGYVADLTIARHQLRKVPLGDEGDMVVDFVHAINSFVRFE